MAATAVSRRKDTHDLTPVVLDTTNLMARDTALETMVQQPSAQPMVMDPMPNGGLDEAEHELIARRAYELYLARGAQDGHDQEDWLTAEREARQQTMD